MFCLTECSTCRAQNYFLTQTSPSCLFPLSRFLPVARVCLLPRATGGWILPDIFLVWKGRGYGGEGRGGLGVKVVVVVLSVCYFEVEAECLEDGRG